MHFAGNFAAFGKSVKADQVYEIIDDDVIVFRDDVRDKTHANYQGYAGNVRERDKHDNNKKRVAYHHDSEGDVEIDDEDEGDPIW